MFFLQLCVAIVDLTLQMNTWNNPIYSFLKCNEIPRTVLLEILKVFPEEIDTKLIRLGANKRNKIQEELSSCAGHLNEFLVLYFSVLKHALSVLFYECIIFY